MQCKIQCELGIWYQDVSDFAILEVMLQNQTQPDTKCNSYWQQELRNRKTKAIWNIAIKKKKTNKKLTIKSCLRCLDERHEEPGGLRFRCEGELRSPEPQILAMTTDSYFVTGNSTVTNTVTSKMDVKVYYKRPPMLNCLRLPRPNPLSKVDEIWTQCSVRGPLRTFFCIFRKN